MRRSSRRHSSDYLENEELYEEYIPFDYDEESGEVAEATEEAVNETEESAESRGGIWLKIGKIALVAIVLITLFFLSMKITELFLDRNQEIEYNTGAPAYNDEESDENIPSIEEENEEIELDAYEEQDKTNPVKPEENEEEPEKPEENEKPAEQKPAEQKPADTPAEQNPADTPSTPTAPSTPSKPSIIPGNPAA